MLKIVKHIVHLYTMFFCIHKIFHKYNTKFESFDDAKKACWQLKSEIFKKFCFEFFKYFADTCCGISDFVMAKICPIINYNE